MHIKNVICAALINSRNISYYFAANLDTGFGTTSDDEALAAQQSQLLQLATTIGQQQQQLHQSMAGDVPATHAFSNRSPILTLRQQTTAFPVDSTHSATNSRRNKHYFAGQTQPQERSSRPSLSGENAFGLVSNILQTTRHWLKSV